MISACDKHVTDIICLKRPTVLDKLINTIPKPQGAIPNFGLPKWKVMPLESKIPMVPGPEGAYNFTRRKIGKELWIPAADAEFNLSDPYCYEMKLTYDSLHDKHLASYFSKPNNIQHLIKAGLITKNLDAKCSLRDYNTYRKYLRRLHCDSIRKELNRRSKWSIEERAIQYAQEQAQKEVRRLKGKKKFEKLRSVFKNRKIVEQLKLQKQKEKQQKIEERLHILSLRKQEAQNLQRIKSKAHAEHIQQKRKAAADHERHKIIRTLLEWRKKEHKHKKAMKMRLAIKREEKRKLVEQKWKERHEFQKKEIEKEQLLLQCIEDQRKNFIEAYREKINKETKRMQKLLKDVKMFINCYLARCHGDRKQICCKNDFDSDDEDPISIKPDLESRVSKLEDTSKTPMGKDADKTRKKETKANKKRSTKGRKVRKVTYRIKTKIEGENLKARKKKRLGTPKGKRRSQSKKNLDEEEEEFELEAFGESISTMKTTESSEAITPSPPSEKCRCQIIKDTMKAIIT